MTRSVLLPVHVYQFGEEGGSKPFSYQLVQVVKSDFPYNLFYKHIMRVRCIPVAGRGEGPRGSNEHPTPPKTN